MAGVIEDSEEQHVIDRIQANAYREVMEEGAAFINRKWIAQKLHRTEGEGETQFMRDWKFQFSSTFKFDTTIEVDASMFIKFIGDNITATSTRYSSFENKYR